MKKSEKAKRYFDETRIRGIEPKGIISRRLDRIEHAIFVIASWIDSGEWNGCAEYVKAIIEGASSDKQD